VEGLGMENVGTLYGRLVCIFCGHSVYFNRVARWHVFQPKILIWVNVGILKGIAMEDVGMFYDIWSI
jgi:hypothetical protein